MSDMASSPDYDALARWLCQWWESDESDAHTDDSTPFPCRLCTEQARALLLAVESGKVSIPQPSQGVEWEWGVTQESDGIVRRGLDEKGARAVASMVEVDSPRHVMRRRLGPWERVTPPDVGAP